MVKNVLAAMVLLVLAGVSHVCTVFAAGETPRKPGQGDVAPLFVSNGLDGAAVDLGKIIGSGNVVLLNFWGLRCANCIEEIAHLNRLHGKYGTEGLMVIGVNVDGARPDGILQQIPRLKNAPKYAVVPDPEFRIVDMYDMKAAPLSFVIGRDGTIHYRHDDFQPGDEVELERAVLEATRGKK